MIGSNRFISCDWGTSSFRLYLVQVSDGSILYSIQEGMGVKAVHELWQQKAEHPRLHYFLQYLEGRIEMLAKVSGQDLSRLPVLISGMASSSIGMLELPYADLPFSLSGRDLLARRVSPEHLARHIWLFSGLKGPNDVMRGEESQLVGLATHFNAEAGVVILPGTHSKHVYIENDAVTAFHTYMTGEFFALLNEHSILRHSLAESDSKEDTGWFEKGVIAGRDQHVLNAAFHVRTNALLHGVLPGQNRSYLSGLLIGSELSMLPADVPVYLCGGGHLADPYQKALAALGRTEVLVLSSSVVEKAVVKAHVKKWKAIVMNNG